MNETVVTLQGNVGSPVTTREVQGATLASFRVACTPRRYLRKTDEWVDQDTQWYTVTAWRTLGEHCAASLEVGHPIVVHGRLRATTWTNSANIEVTSFEVEAATVGHDLNRGTSGFAKRGEPTARTEADAVAAPAGTEEPAAV